MKKIASFLLALVLLTGLVGAVPVSAAGSASISASKSTVPVGGSVTVTAAYSGGGQGIGSLDAYFHYNTKVFEYVSCSGATAAGGAGTIKISYFCQGLTAPKKLTVSITLKAIGVGGGDFKWETEGMYSDNDDLLGTPGKSLSVSCTNPTKSGDATLNFLRPSQGTLTPKFDKNVTNYSVTVPYSVTRCLLNYSTTDPHAQTSIAGSADLKVGKNTRTVTVTAQNGTTKKYTVVITREAAPNTTAPSNPTGTNTTAPTKPVTPPKDALEVEVDGKPMVIAGDQPGAKLPANFKWDFATFGDVEVPAAKHNKAELTLLYLMEQEGDGAGFYYYDAASDTFTPYHKLTADKAVYSVHNLPESVTAPAGTVAGTFTYKEVEVSAFLYEDAALKDFAILYVTTPEGLSGLYTFDSAEKTFQRYVEIVQPQPEVIPDTPVDTQEKDDQSGLMAFVEEHQTLLYIGVGAVAALGLLIFAIILLVRICSGGKRKGKH